VKGVACRETPRAGTEGGKPENETRQKEKEETRSKLLPDMGLEPMIFSPAAGQIACEFSFA
jgi:hypothetical protein